MVARTSPGAVLVEAWRIFFLNGVRAMAEHTIDVSVRGKWFSVPALTLNGKDTVVRGRWVRTAVIEDEEWLETEIDDPEQCIKTLKAQKSKALRADIFTFAQKLPATRPKYNYP